MPSDLEAPLIFSLCIGANRSHEAQPFRLLDTRGRVNGSLINVAWLESCRALSTVFMEPVLASGLHIKGESQLSSLLSDHNTPHSPFFHTSTVNAATSCPPETGKDSTLCTLSCTSTLSSRSTQDTLICHPSSLTRCLLSILLRDLFLRLPPQSPLRRLRCNPRKTQAP
jgi:hypothetical protein